MKMSKKARKALAVALSAAMVVTGANISGRGASAAKKAGVKLNKTKLSLTEGKTATLKVKKTKIKSMKVTWKSSKKSVATVNKKGKVTAKKAGSAKISAKVKYKVKGSSKAKTKTLKCKVTVKAKSTKNPVATKAPAPSKAPIPSNSPAPSAKASASAVPGTAASKAPVVSNDPGTGDTPVTSDDPGMGDTPVTSDDPGTGNTPATSDDPGTGDEPATSDKPGTGDKPATSDKPGTGDKPATSNNPGKSPTPATTPDNTSDNTGSETGDNTSGGTSGETSSGTGDSAGEGTGGTDIGTGGTGSETGGSGTGGTDSETGGTGSGTGGTGSGTGGTGGETGGNPDDDTHTHTIATEWSSDAENHWHAASCGNAEHNEDIAPHKYEYTVDKGNATLHVGTCVCGKTTAPEAHKYKYAAPEGNTTQHVGTCVCGETTEPEAHIYGEWNITQKAAPEHNGSKNRICKTCEYEDICTYGMDITITASATNNSGALEKDGDDKITGAFSLGCLDGETEKQWLVVDVTKIDTSGMANPCIEITPGSDGNVNKVKKNESDAYFNCGYFGYMNKNNSYSISDDNLTVENSGVALGVAFCDATQVSVTVYDRASFPSWNEMPKSVTLTDKKEYSFDLGIQLPVEGATIDTDNIHILIQCTANSGDPDYDGDWETFATGTLENGVVKITPDKQKIDNHFSTCEYDFAMEKCIFKVEVPIKLSDGSSYNALKYNINISFNE